MYIDLDIFCFAVPFTTLFSSAWSVATGIGGCWWNIYAREVHMDVAFWQFSNNLPNSSSVVDAMTFLIRMNSACTGPFSGYIDSLGVLYMDLSPRENINLLCCMPLVLRFSMDQNRCVGSF